MNPETAVLDAIDELVDEQLEQEASGWDHNINQPHCPHAGCQARWHGLPHARCPGSAVQGPLKPPAWPATRPKVCGRVSIIDADGNQTHVGHVRDFVIDVMPDQEAVAEFRETLGQFHSAMRGVFQQLELSFRAVGEQAHRLAEILGHTDFADGGEITPQQRALPRPSTTPPMWAARADGRRRR
ncbi:hypothetical protein KNU54_gp02 [Gordonia phage VanDeWege]|uniref:Uncharacterized protein n=1 Tax=Gordonia phage VanDeWege TaxID=2588131 RepID=A0A4Y5TZV5_9CAUD|nr:hypothetical protein KNU54_gp02 [Gordonia phage VanDeWege]QDB74585.1 hypothetical protein SEA_VANDEWEGE_2 [Gordonia phage VanDeWege]